MIIFSHENLADFFELGFVHGGLGGGTEEDFI